MSGVKTVQITTKKLTNKDGESNLEKFCIF
jgi:hypothetical protein